MRKRTGRQSKGNAAPISPGAAAASDATAPFPPRHLPSKPPGTLMVPEAAVVPGSVHVIRYNAAEVEEYDAPCMRDALARTTPDSVCWINVNGLGNLDLLIELRDLLGFHPLALEDVLHVAQRPKVEEYPKHLFVVLRMVSFHEGVATEQLSIFLGDRILVTFQEREGDCLEGVRTRIRKGGGQIRTMNSDYLLYAIIDAVTDSYFPVLEEIGDRIEACEEKLLVHPDAAVLAQVHGLRRSLLGIRRLAWPLREALNSMIRDANPRLGESVRLYLRDCYDHTVQILDLLESYRELAAGLMDLYLSTVSNRMNEVMKVLTIIATVFIPLTFVAGVYGMNFDHMPELHWSWGYPAVLAGMALMAVAMLAMFRRKGWLGGQTLLPVQDQPEGAPAPPDPTPPAPGRGR